MCLVTTCKSLLLCCFMAAQVGPKLMSVPPASILPEPRDEPFRGTLQLTVDARDTEHSVFRVSEEIPVQATGDMVLLYPEWETTSHGPTASAVELAGLKMQIDRRDMEWHRDTFDAHAFHVTVPPGARRLTVGFEYLSPRPAAELRPDMVDVQWQRLLLYPAGWYLRDIHVAAQLSLPTGLQPFTALAPASGSVSSAGLFVYAPETLDRLVDSPVYAARYLRRLELASSGSAAVHLDLIADAPSELAISTRDQDELKTLVQQTAKVFGTPPYRHYDALVSLSDELSPGGGLEHLEEGENNLPANYFTEPEWQLNNRDLIAHEYVHAWNGRFRQPVGLWSPNLNLPTDPSLLWVYEGQTEFWGRILAARSGLRTVQQTLDKLALDASLVANRTGRGWKSLADSTLDVLYMSGHAVAWRDWQRREDYYSEGVLLWLDVDSRIRELSHEEYGLDNFAQEFFATRGNSETVSTYSLKNVCDALSRLAPTDWEGFLNQHLLTHKTADAMAGLSRAGWQLSYSEIPTETFLQDEADAGVTNVDTSLGMQVRADGTVRSVAWNGPAFRAGLAPGIRIATVNGQPYSREGLLNATNASRSTPVQVAIQNGDLRREVKIPYSGTLRYPHLERIPSTPDRLTPLLAARL